MGKMERVEWEDVQGNRPAAGTESCRDSAYCCGASNPEISRAREAVACGSTDDSRGER